MLSRKTLGVAGAAMLGSVALLGTNAAHATINLDTDKDKVVYAKETVTLSRTVGSATYYVVMAGPVNGDNADALTVQSKVGFAIGNNANVVVNVTLTNMVFNTPLSRASLTVIPNTDTTIDAEDRASDITPAQISLSAKGQAGDNTAQFVIRTAANEDAGSSALFNLVLRDVAVKDGAGGTISIEAADIALPSFFTSTATTAGAVRLADALAVTTGSPVDDPATANVSDDFMKFEINTASLATNKGLVATVGQLSMSVPSVTVDDPDNPGTDLTTYGRRSAENSAPIMSVGSVVNAARSSVTFGGAYEFADSIVWGDAELSTLSVDKEGNATGWKSIPIEITSPPADEARAAQFAGNLVVTVDGTTVIPEGDYIANLQLQPQVVGSLFPPPTRQVTVGEIIHNGVTVHLPYLTTDERYNQRIIIVSRAPEAVRYSMTFNSEANVMATPGMAANGMLAANSTTVLNMRSGDLVTIEGGPPHRVSGTLIVAAQTKHISVATNQTNRETGGTDTVVYR